MQAITRHVPPGYALIEQVEDLGIEIYAKLADKICAICYSGKRTKADWHYQFQSEAMLKDRVITTIESRRIAQEIKAKRVAERNAPHNLALGDILVSSWGFDQTNIDYYQVTQLVSKSFIEVTLIAQERTYDSSMSGDCTPVIDKFVGEPIKRKVSTIGGKPYIKIDSYRSAHFEEPITVVGQVKQYRPLGWSSYA